MAETGKTIHLEIITPDAAVFNDDVEFVLVRALDGDLGIMPNHAPLIASLRVWPLLYDKDGKRSCVCVASGFLEMKDNKITVITPAAELPEQIDLERAERSRDRAEKRLQEKAQNLDEARAEASLERALHRIDVAQKYGGK